MLKEFPASLPGNILRRPGCKKGAEEFVSAAAELQHTFKVSIGNIVDRPAWAKPFYQDSYRTVHKPRRKRCGTGDVNQSI